MWGDAGFWLSVDPLADKYPGLTPYLYCNGNPIMLVDPDGNLVISSAVVIKVVGGALTGAAIECTTQVATNMLVNKQSFFEAVSNVDGTSVSIAAATGALGSGSAIVAGKLVTAGKAAKVAVTAANSAAIDAFESAAKQYNEEKSVDAKKVGLDAIAGQVSNGLGAVVKVAAQKTRIYKVLLNHVDHAERVAKGNSPRQSRVAKVEDAKQNVADYLDEQATKVTTPAKIVGGVVVQKSISNDER